MLLKQTPELRKKKRRKSGKTGEGLIRAGRPYTLLSGHEDNEIPFSWKLAEAYVHDRV